MNNNYDAIIIGAGIIGTCISLELSRRGKRVLVLDKESAAGAGSTINTCAIIRTHYSTLEGTAMAYESYLHWKHWADYLQADDERGLAHLIETGLLILLGEGSDMNAHLAHHRALNIPFEEWNLETLRERMPFMNTHGFYPPHRPGDKEFGIETSKTISGAIFIPSAGYINDPQLSVHNVQRAAEANGAVFRFNARVAKIHSAEGRVSGVTLENGEKATAPVVVNASGPHSFQINRLAGIEENMKIKTRALRHEVHFVPTPEEYDVSRHGIVTSDDDIGGYNRPEVGDLLLIGSQDPDCDAKDWVDDPDNFDREVSEEQWRAQVYRQALRIPELPVPSHSRGIADLYDVTDDWIPIYDKSDLPGFYMAVGTSGNQYKNGPMVGIMMATLIEASEKGHDHDADPVTVACPYTGEMLNAGFYSRNREVNSDSSFSVLG